MCVCVSVQDAVTQLQDLLRKYKQLAADAGVLNDKLHLERSYHREVEAERSAAQAAGHTATQRAQRAVERLQDCQERHQRTLLLLEVRAAVHACLLCTLPITFEHQW